MGRRLVTVLSLAFAAILETGCLVSIDHVEDPTAAFDAARREAARFAGKKGPAHHVNVLVWNGHDREMVKVSVPMWLARKLENASADWEHEGDGDDSERRAARRVKRHLSLKDLEKAGLGILVEVEEDEGDRVLVWLR
jgi:hypothetical protein